MYRKKKKIFCYINNKNNLDNLFYINILPLNISNPQNIVSRLRFVMVTFFRPTRTGRAKTIVAPTKYTSGRGPGEKKSGPVRAPCIVAARTDVYAIYNREV